MRSLLRAMPLLLAACATPGPLAEHMDVGRSRILTTLLKSLDATQEGTQSDGSEVACAEGRGVVPGRDELRSVANARRKMDQLLQNRGLTEGLPLNVTTEGDLACVRTEPLPLFK